jgi:hypothetical protein
MRRGIVLAVTALLTLCGSASLNSSVAQNKPGPTVAPQEPSVAAEKSRRHSLQLRRRAEERAETQRQASSEVDSENAADAPPPAVTPRRRHPATTKPDARISPAGRRHPVISIETCQETPPVVTAGHDANCN